MHNLCTDLTRQLNNVPSILRLSNLWIKQTTIIYITQFIFIKVDIRWTPWLSINNKIMTTQRNIIYNNNKERPQGASHQHIHIWTDIGMKLIFISDRISADTNLLFISFSYWYTTSSVNYINLLSYIRKQGKLRLQQQYHNAISVSFVHIYVHYCIKSRTSFATPYLLGISVKWTSHKSSNC